MVLALKDDNESVWVFPSQSLYWKLTEKPDPLPTFVLKQGPNKFCNEGCLCFLNWEITFCSTLLFKASHPSYCSTKACCSANLPKSWIYGAPPKGKTILLVPAQAYIWITS